ncbi:MAG: amidase [Alphaproteobacteria bacterium]|nr:amidase [Alphaproteobacteria bacterium]MDP6516432.1 amidase [Alphaproteobacteria bacterium]
MTDSNPAFLTAGAAAAEIHAGRLSPVDLVDALLARIDGLEPKLGAFVSVWENDARQAAEAAHKAIGAGHAVGPWHGVPIALKDIVEVEGRVTMGGSQHWAGRISEVTATLARRLIAAGMIVIGKTHTVEFAMGGWGTNRHLGTPWNPWDLEVHRTPGGSSSGSGVATAARLAPWAIGSDTGGSVRVPSAWCGLTGLKTTIGRVSVHGVLPLAPTMDTPGPIARDVEDAAQLYCLLQGPDANDPLTLRHAPDDPLPALRRGIAGLRLGTMADSERAGVDAELLAAYDAAVDQLADLGARVETLALPQSTEAYGAMVGRLIGAESYPIVGALVDDPDLPLDDDVRPRIQLGRDMTASDYLRLLRDREAHKRNALLALDGFDAWLTPTTVTPALPVAEVDQTTTPARFTRPLNFLDWCALALPCGFTAGGLPLSLQISCRGHDEATALRIGWAYQQATDWHRRVPPGLDD